MLLCFATNNAHKLDEVRPLLAGQFELKTLAEIGCREELPETTGTIAGNAAQKARYVWEHYGVACFADDTGLEVTALGGAPGVDSAYYAGTRDAAANMQKVLDEVAGQPDRTARFRTVVAYVDAAGVPHSFEGIVPGRLLEAPRGAGGFGYDPIFVPEGYEQTFAELPLAEKNRISHRARAVAALAAFLNQAESQ